MPGGLSGLSGLSGLPGVAGGGGGGPTYTPALKFNDARNSMYL